MRALAYEDDEILEARQRRGSGCRVALALLCLVERRFERRVWRRRESRLGIGGFVCQLDHAHRLERDVLNHVIGHGLAHQLQEVAVVERAGKEGRGMTGVRGGHDEMKIICDICTGR